MTEMAAIIGNSSDSEKWKNLAEKFRPLWHNHHYNASSGLYGYNAEDGYVVQSLTGAAIYGDFIPSDLKESVLGNYSE